MSFDISNNNLGAIRSLLELLADPVRQEIVLRFRERSEWGAGEMAATFGLSRPTISHHLNMLERGGVLAVRKEGKERHYRFNGSSVLQTLDALSALIRSCCP